MMFWTNEPLEGVAFDVQDHAWRTGTRGSVHMGRWSVRTSMGLKSPIDGRWDGRGRTELWRALAWRRRRTPSSGRFGRDWPMGDQPLQVVWWLWWAGRHQGRLDDSWRMWQHVWTLWHVWQLAGGPEGPTFCSLDADYAQKGPMSPQRGLTSPILALLWHF